MFQQLRFRNIYSETYKQRFEGVQPSNVLGESNMVRANSKYFAFPWHTTGGGSLAVLENDKPQQLPTTFPKITGHQGKILDLEFYPFDENIIATSSEDTTIKLWYIPEDFKEDLVEPIVTFSSHDKKVTLITFNPVSKSILASGSTDNLVKIWNVEDPNQEIQNIQGPDNCQGLSSLEWNYNGSLLGTIWKDKNMRIIDPRSSDNFVLSCVECFEGLKSQKYQWVGAEDKCITAGFSKKFERQIKLWDLKNLSAPVQTISLDSAAGLIFPFYDEDTQVLYIACKGEGSIKKFEYSQGQLFSVGAHTSPDSGSLYGFFPKKCVNVSTHELMKAIKITDKYIEFISFRAPRKSTNYQPDLYPDCYAGIAAQSSQDYINGQNANPIKEQVLKYQKQQVTMPKQISNANQNFFSSQQISSQQQQQDPENNNNNQNSNVELEIIKKQKSDLQKVVESLRSENVQLKEIVKNLEDKCAQQQQQIQVNQNQSQDYSFIKTQQQEEELAELQRELKIQQENVENYRNQFSELQAINKDLQLEAQILTSKMKDQQNQLVSQHQQQIHQYEAKIAQLAQSNQDQILKNQNYNNFNQESDVSELLLEIKQLKNLNEQQQIEIADLKISKVMENDENNQVEQIIIQQKMIQEQNAKIKDLEDQNLNLKQDLLIYQAKEMTQDEALIYQTKIELIEEKLKQRKFALTQAADSIKILKKRNQELEQTVQNNQTYQ